MVVLDIDIKAIQKKDIDNEHKYAAYMRPVATTEKN